MTSARVANRNHMTSFYFRTIGCLARNPELVTSEEASYYRFCLTGHDYTEDEQGQCTLPRISRSIDRHSAARQSI